MVFDCSRVDKQLTGMPVCLACDFCFCFCFFLTKTSRHSNPLDLKYCPQNAPMGHFLSERYGPLEWTLSQSSTLHDHTRNWPTKENSYRKSLPKCQLSSKFAIAPILDSKTANTLLH